jgi:PKD repeat protein
MKKIVTLLLTLFGCVALGSAQDSISVLFIGNSYTYANDLPATTKSLAFSLGKTITFQTKANGGYTFQNHVNDPATYAALHAKPWDVVVLQGQSQEPSFPYSQVNSGTIPFAQRLSDSVYANNSCGNVMYFMTWGRETGDPQWDSINTFDKMNARLYQTYMRIADSSNSAMVSPVGAVWKYVRDNFPAISLYVGDGSHPSEAGTYLAACTFFTSLFQTTPVGASFIGNLDAQTASTLQQAVATVLLPNLSTYHLHPVDEPTYANFSTHLNSGNLQTSNISAQASSYLWDFGDGATSTLESPIHDYAAAGTYVVVLTAVGGCNTDTAMQTVEVQTLGIAETAFSDAYWYSTETAFRMHGINSKMNIEFFTEDGKEVFPKMLYEENTVMAVSSEVVLFVRITDKSGDSRTWKMLR